jgi:hypothetical protein
MALELPQGRGRRFDNSRHETHNASLRRQHRGTSVHGVDERFDRSARCCHIDYLYAYVTTVFDRIQSVASSLFVVRSTLAVHIVSNT